MLSASEAFHSAALQDNAIKDVSGPWWLGCEGFLSDDSGFFWEIPGLVGLVNIQKAIENGDL